MLDRGYADFRESDTGEVRRISLLGTWVNKAKRTVRKEGLVSRFVVVARRV